MTLDLLEALEFLAHVLAGPVVEPYPAITPDTWADMRCRVYACPVRSCRCAWCSWERHNRGAVEAWALSSEKRPHARYALPFGSLSAALEALLRQRAGATVRSQAGSLIDRAASINALEACVQVTRRADRDDRTTRDADLAVDVERAVVHAYQQPAARRGLPTAACVTLLLASIDSTAPPAEAWAGRLGVPTAVVVGVVRSGRRGATVDLAARDIIPEPRARQTLRAVGARREELTR